MESFCVCPSDCKHGKIVFRGYGASLKLLYSMVRANRLVSARGEVKLKPGKPVWFGVRNSNDRSTIVFGLPGNPVSSLVGFQLFVRATIDQLTGGTAGEPQPEFCVLANDH